MKEEDIDKKLKTLWDEVPQTQDEKTKLESWDAFSSRVFPKETKKSKSKIWQMAAAAAIAALLSLGGLALYKVASVDNFSNYKLIENSTAQIKEVPLPDGSIVQLEPQSTLEYANNFTENRKIRLTGAAFFDVRKDPQHPFSVACEQTTTTVLGTTFTIDHHSGDKVTVRLYEGRVRMEVKGNTEDWILAAGEVFVYQQSQVSIFEFNRFKDFEKVPLKEVVNYIEESYQYDLNLPQQLLDQATTLRINKKERFDNIVEILAEMYNLKATVDERQKVVTFKY